MLPNVETPSKDHVEFVWKCRFEAIDDCLNIVVVFDSIMVNFNGGR